MRQQCEVQALMHRAVQSEAWWAEGVGRENSKKEVTGGLAM
jgi:hypothetical protein